VAVRSIRYRVLNARVGSGALPRHRDRPGLRARIFTH